MWRLFFQLLFILNSGPLAAHAGRLHIGSYRDYKESVDKGKFNFNDIDFRVVSITSVDSFHKFGFDFTSFSRLNRFSLDHTEAMDSLLENLIVENIGQIPTLDAFSTSSPFRLDYSGLNGVTRLYLAGSGCRDNSSIGELQSVKVLKLKSDEFAGITREDPVFTLKNVEELELFAHFLKPFPFDLLSEFPLVVRTRIMGCDLETIPESWLKLENLREIEIYSKKAWKELPDYICKFANLDQLNLYIQDVVPDPPPCLLNSGICISLEVETKSRRINKKAWKSFDSECVVVHRSPKF